MTFTRSPILITTRRLVFTYDILLPKSDFEISIRHFDIGDCWILRAAAKCLPYAQK